MGKVKRVLIYRLGSLGDTAVALPSLHLVARAFPDAERRLLTNFPVDVKAPPAAAVLGDSGLVSGYFRYAVGTRSVLDLAKLWWQLRRWRPDVLVYLGAARGVESARRDARFLRLCGAKRMVGVPLTEAMQKNLYGQANAGYEYEVTYGDLEPEASRLARNIAELGDARLDDPASWDLLLTSTERNKAREAIGVEVLAEPMIAVSVGTKVQAKDWGRENWRALLAELAAACPGYGLLLAGAAEESEASEFAASGWPAAGGGPVVNLSGKLTPRETAAAISFAKIFVGHDSGPMHLAAAVQVPCVAIFAARNVPRVWFPFGDRHRVVYHPVNCMGCGLETCIVERKKCILSITVDEVVEVVSCQLSAVSKASSKALLGT
jgi:heptosyltransferase III